MESRRNRITSGVHSARDSHSNFVVSGARSNVYLTVPRFAYESIEQYKLPAGQPAEFELRERRSSRRRGGNGINSVVSPSRGEKNERLTPRIAKVDCSTRRFETAPRRRQIAKLLFSNAARADSPGVL